jgi:hypothetical protein
VTREVYGAAAGVPPGAFVYFDGVDEKLGRLAKYAAVIDDGHTR